MKIRKAVLLLACAVSWGIAVWFAGRLWAAYPLVSVRSDVPVTGRQLEALRSALRQEDGASALVPAFWSQAEGSAESRWETCGITAILYCGEYDAVYPAVLLEGRFPAAQENGKCAVSTAAAWQLWGSEDVLGQELEIEGDIYRVCGLFRSSASLALCGESLDHGFSNIEFWGGYAAPPVETVQQLLRAAGIAQQVTLYFPFPWMAALTAYALCPAGLVLREISVPDGYLIEQRVIPVEFTYENQFIAWQVVDCLHSDKQTTVEIDKRAFTSDSDDTFALTGATLTVTDWNGNVVDSWESSDTAHVICGLHLSHDFAGNRDTSKVYTLAETCPADGYTTARSIQFRLEQATDDNAYLQETAVWVLHESEDTAYQSGSIISPTAFSDDTVATISAKLRAFWDKLLGKNPDADGVVIANWYCVNGTLVVNFTDAANDRAIAKCLRESDFSDLTFDKAYLNGAAAPAFFADKQVAEKPADAEITYSASWILLKDSDGFSQTVTMLDAPTRVKISKADITTHEEVPGATLRVLDKDGNVVDEWVSEDTPHYMEAVLVAGETYTLEETLVPDNSGYVPANAIQFTVEDNGKVQHVIMQDDYTKVQISKTDIATGKEISGAKLKITDADGKTVAEWVTDGTPHYMERIPMGTYTLTETVAPIEQGYVRAESVTFEVGPTENIQRVEMKDDFTKVEIFKADMTDGHELPGAKLKITDASGNTIAEWETNGQPHRIERLKPGDYTLTETAAPAGYLLSEEVHFTVQETGEIQKVTMYDAPAHSLILTKRDIATNAKLADARLTIRDAYGTTIDRWTTTDGDHAIRVLPERSAAKDPHKNLLLLSDDTSEHVYTMVEELAPNGYLVAESITFKVMQMNDTLVVFVWQDGGWQKSSEGYLAMYDERTDTPVPLMKTFPQTGNIL